MSSAETSEDINAVKAAESWVLSQGVQWRSSDDQLRLEVVMAIDQAGQPLEEQQKAVVWTADPTTHGHMEDSAH